MSFLFSPRGRLPAQPFAVSAALIYLAGIASHLLTMPDVITRAALWPFIAAQAVLIWIWYVLHARRLHDAGRGTELAAGVALLYALSIVLLLIVADGFFNTSDSVMTNANAGGALNLILMVYVIGSLLASTHYDFAWIVIAILTFMAFVPIIVALCFTVWTATRPGVAPA